MLIFLICSTAWTLSEYVFFPLKIWPLHATYLVRLIPFFAIQIQQLLYAATEICLTSKQHLAVLDEMSKRSLG
jgi:hypothetical protein